MTTNPSAAARPTVVVPRPPFEAAGPVARAALALTDWAERWVPDGWVVSAYDLGEAVANLVQPFWMLPILSLLQLRARDVMGYTFIVFIVLVPLVVTLVTLMGMTLSYPL